MSAAAREFQESNRGFAAGALGYDVAAASAAPFFGRERETATLVALLAVPGSVVYVHGPGGVGKSRLALHVAGLAKEHGNTRWCGVSARSGESDLLASLESLTADLSPAAPALVVLDEAEHLHREVVRAIFRLRAQSPLWTFLATSRVATCILDAHTIALEPFAVPNLETAVTEKAVSSDAVRFFVERAQAARPAFRLNPANRTQIARLCVQLDGLPLALELAAAQMRFVTAAELIERFDDGALRWRIAERTVTASVAALDEDARALFARLGVFASRWTLTEVEELLCDDPAFSESLHEALAALIERSLVHVDDDGPASVYRYLSASRDVARRELAAAGMLDAYETRLVRITAAAMTARASRIDAGDPDAWAEVDARIATIRLVVGGLRPRDPEAAARTLVSVGRYWKDRGYVREMLAAVAAFDDPLDEGLASQFRSTEGIAARHTADFRRAGRAFEAAIVHAERDGDPRLLTLPTLGSAAVAFNLGNYELARQRIERARASASPMGTTLARVIVNAAVLDWATGRFDEALRAYDEVEREWDDDHLRMTCALGRALCHAARGEHEIARDHVERARERAKTLSAFDRVYVSKDAALVALFAADGDKALAEVTAMLAEAVPGNLLLYVIVAAEVVAASSAATRDPAILATLLGFAEEMRRKSGARPEPVVAPMVTRGRDAIQRRLGRAAFAQCTARGTTLNGDAIATLIATLPPRSSASPLQRLTPREREIAFLVGVGRTNREIAEMLTLSARTVENHIASIFTKLEVARRSQIAALVVASPLS